MAVPHRIGTLIRAIALCLGVAFGAARGVAAQQSAPGAEGPTTIGASIGTWAGTVRANVRLGVSVDHYMGSFVARAEVFGLPWNTTACNGGYPLGCGETHLLKRFAIGGRLMDRDGETHPFFGFGIAYLELGIRQDASRTAGLEFRLLTEVVGANDGPIGGSSISIGGWYAFR